MTEFIHSLSDGQITGIIIGAIALIVAAVPSIIAAIKTIPQIIKNKNWAQIKKIADNAIAIAEATTLDGDGKKKMVIQKVQDFCNEMNIDLNVEELANYIDEAIKWFNTMIKANKEKK